jgi:hypothetical protein
MGLGAKKDRDRGHDDSARPVWRAPKPQPLKKPAPGQILGAKEPALERPERSLSSPNRLPSAPLSRTLLLQLLAFYPKHSLPSVSVTTLPLNAALPSPHPIFQKAQIIDHHYISSILIEN